MKSLKTLLMILLPVCLLSCASTFELARNPKNVLYVSPTGNDDTAWYGTSNRPWASISAAALAAQPGDKILVLPGTYSNNTGGVVITLPPQCQLRGYGTNSTFIYNGLLQCNISNEVSGLTWNSDNLGITGAGTTGGAFHVLTNNYIHDVVVVSANKCLTSDPGTVGVLWNVFSNCVFLTSYHGAIVQGTQFFFNCAISKTNNTASDVSYLLGSQFNASVYWSGGSITSTTNATSNPTNSVGVWHGGLSSGGDNIYLQNTTVSVQTGGYDLFGKSAATNFVSNVTYTKTNSAAINIPFAGFPNTNSVAWKFQASWQARINTNAMFLLPAPPTNSP